MKNKLLFEKFFLALLLSAGVALTSCVEEATRPDDGFMLYYETITEIAPGTNMSITPTWYGGVPAAFSIVGITLDGEPVQTDCFQVNPENGVFSIQGSEEMEVGEYKVSVQCTAASSVHRFDDIIVVKMMKPVPDGIIVEPAELAVKLSDILKTGEGVVLPSAQIKADGEGHVRITEYLIANVWRDGKLANECKDWFALDQEGQFTIKPDNMDFEAGHYVFDFKLVTYIVGKASEKGIFKEALKLNVTSAPTMLAYAPAVAKVEKGMAGKSVKPSVKGSVEGLEYRIKSVAPSNEVGITIDAATGELQFPESDKTEVGDKFKVSLTVSNDYGATDFEGAFTFEVISFIAPITAFTYEDMEVISGVSFNHGKKTMDGTEVTYSFKALPEALSALEIDGQTGQVSLAKGIELPVGEHVVTVLAENVKGKKETAFKINVVANPNYFTYVRWGNNLGENGEALLPLEKYGNQFRAVHGSGKLKMEIVESDLPEGRPVAYKSVKPSTANGGIAVNGKSGRLEVYTKDATENKNTLSFTVIEVTVGEGEAAITRKFPVFVDFCGTKMNGCEIFYTPFAIRVNPKTGGRSAAPVIIDKEGNDISSTLTMDFHTNAAFFNINGPASHGDATMLKNDSADKTFLVDVWKKYFSAVSDTYVRSAYEPMSWYANEKSLTTAAAYIDNADKCLVVNPEKFVDADGNYADGAVYMTLSFSASGRNPHSSPDKTEANRLFIWLDPTYTE